MEQEKLEAIVNALQAEWQCGGLGPDTMYGEFAIEVAKRAVAAERERCAKLCEQTDDDGEGPDCWGWHAKDYARAIRGA